MDRKTLEYMEERATKARGIVKEIEQLTKVAYEMVQASIIRFQDHNYTLVGQIGAKKTSDGPAYPEIVRLVRTTAIESINAEIAELEAELLTL